MNHIKCLLAVALGTIQFVGCNESSNPVTPIVWNDSLWAIAHGLQGSNTECGFAKSGNNLVTSSYCNLCEQAAIFISTDEGLSWELDTTLHVYNHYDTGQITNPLWLPAPMKFIDDGTYLIAGEGDVYHGDLYRSSDNGVTWSDRNISWPVSDSNQEDIYCFCLLHGKIFAGTDDGIFVSTDHGITWMPANSGIPKTAFHHLPISALATTGTSLFASTWGFGIYRSDNDGASWKIVNTTNYTFEGLAASGSEIFAAAFNEQGKPSTGGVFISRDNGGTWQHADATLPDHGVGAICSSGPYLFAATDTVIFVSSDQGTTWIGTSSATILGGTATVLWADNAYLFAGGWGQIWRYPLYSSPGKE